MYKRQHAHIEAGNEEDTRQQDAAHGAEQQAHHIGEGLRPVGRVGECAARQSADVGQHAVDRQQHPSGDHPARTVPCTTAPSSSTPRARMFTAMTMPKARAAMVSMV